MPREPIEANVTVLQRARREGKRVFLMGNGESAATASPVVNDLLKGATQIGQPRFKVMCLSDNVATLTACANDTSYEMIFAEPLVVLAESGDIVIAEIGCATESSDRPDAKQSHLCIGGVSSWPRYPK